ncbi:hypothetical protein TYRP_004177 [Tyrophagus putrescentiae]|nr:hypothetical protein TYRP_004177 [Tyrophagus putrescentiae]
MSLSLDCTSASSVQRVSGIKRRSILSIVTRLVRRQAVGRPTLGKKNSEKGAAFEQNGGLDAVAATATTNTNNWPDVPVSSSNRGEAKELISDSQTITIQYGCTF